MEVLISAPKTDKETRKKEDAELESARRWLQEAANKEVSDGLLESENPGEERSEGNGRTHVCVGCGEPTGVRNSA